jgi:hypothetical protein
VEAPRARLVLTEVPEGIAVTLPGGGKSVLLDPSQMLPVRLARALARGEEDPYEIHVHASAGLDRLYALGWGGRTNFVVWFHEREGWVAYHAGHTQPIFVNGRAVHRRHTLSDGDRIEPARGLVLTFVHEQARGLAS